MSKIPIFNAVRVIPREEGFLNRNVGNRGEIYYDKDSNSLRLFDGDNRGGFSIARSDFENVPITAFRNKSVGSGISTVVYTVTVTGPQNPDTGNKYSLNGVYRPEPNFVVGYTYVFVQDDQTNVYFPNANGTTPNPHPLNFSSDNLSGERGGGTSYLVNVRYFLDGVSVSQSVYNSTAFNTATSRQVWITVTNSTPSTLYYWCWNHQAMGNEISVADPGSGGSGGNTTVTVSQTAPTSPNAGNLWLSTTNGNLYVYIDDGDSQQWIQPSGPYPDLSAYALSSSLSAYALTSSLSAYALNSSLSAYALNSSLSAYATLSYVNSAIGNIPKELFDFSVAADDSTQRLITSGNTIKFIGAGGVTTSSDNDGNITITGGATTGNVTFVGTTIDTSDSSAIVFTPAVVLESDLTVENELTASILNADVINITGEITSIGSGTPELVSDNEILLTAGTRVEITSSPFKVASFSSAERDLLLAQNGDLIYNTTTNKFQGYENGSWVDLV
jgi:hypothetical protein